MSQAEHAHTIRTRSTAEAQIDRQQVEALIERAIAYLDTLDGDPDLEPDADDEDTATERHGFSFVASGPDDEEDDAPREDDDPGEENGDREPDVDDEASRQSTRLDVALVGEESRHG